MHLDGTMETSTLADLEPLLAELADADEEHPDVSVIPADGAAVSAMPGCRVYVEDMDDDSAEPRWTTLESQAVVLELFRAIAKGQHDVLDDFTWQSGYPDD